MIEWDKTKEGTLLVISWEDILARSVWLSDKEAQETQPAHCKTVGWFVNDDEFNIRVTDTVAEDGDKSVMVIPKGCIRKVQIIKYKR
ncbi:MAG: hypothetical protein IMZ70_05225 [Candidatus Atribacteria bacterium]|nr:hypothetical protein [Candidatus Atribacteria bacterium]